MVIEKLKQKLSAALAALLTACTVSGCHTTEGQNIPDTPEVTGNVTLTVFDVGKAARTREKLLRAGVRYI
jgi:hypothetical protein